MKLNIKYCDFCHSKDLSYVYEVPDSRLKASIYVCSNCSLTQSLSKKNPAIKERVVTTSSGANWGNIRHGKGLRLEKALPYLTELFNKSKIKEIIDIGSNRGDFIVWLNKNYPKIKITGVEPDKNVIDLYKNLKNSKLYTNRLENIDLPKDKFDFVYCSHTLEHADSASAMLKKIFEITKINGYVFLEIPNIEIIKDGDVVEEFFIDKHTFHFNRSLLIEYLKYLDFAVIEGENSKDKSNITLIIKKTRKQIPTKDFDKRNLKLVDKNKLIIKKYKKILTENRKKLKTIAKKLYEFSQRQRVIFWGGGRIFDSLVVYGGLKTDKLLGVIDKYLYKLIPSVHGVILKSPEFLRFSPPDVVVILAKSSTDEIEKEVRSYGIRHVIKFADLITSI